MNVNSYNPSIILPLKDVRIDLTPDVQKSKKSARYSREAIALGVMGAVATVYCLWQSGVLHWAGRGISDLSSRISPSSRPSPWIQQAFVPDINYVPSKSSEIHVFTSYTRQPERLAMSQKVMTNQLSYCKKQGYQYEVYEKNLADLGPSDSSLPYWSKIAGMNHLLNDKASNAKWFLWLDDDAIVLNQQVRIEDVIRQYGQNPNHHVIVTEDVPQATTNMNTGVLIVRNSDESRAFFQDIWKMRHETINVGMGLGYRYSSCPEQRCFHEQKAMHDLLRQKPHYQDIVNIIPQRANGLGINTFKRFDHFDDDRSDPKTGNAPLPLIYDDKTSVCKDGDFICQCTGLAMNGRRNLKDKPTNLRAECIDDLLTKVIS